MILSTLLLCLAVPQEPGPAVGFDPLTARLASAQSAYRLGEFGRAHDLLKAALEATPDEPELRLWFARVLTDLGRPGEAEEVLAPALIGAPRAVRLLTENARALAAQGDTEAALGTYRSVLDIYPQSGPARLGLAQLRLTRGELEEAQAVLTPLYAQAPAEPAVILCVARLYEAEGRTEDARALLRSHTQSESSPSSLRLALARLLLDSDPQQAWEAVEPLLEGDRTLDELLFLARVARRVDRRIDALAALGSALIEDPTHPEVLEELTQLVRDGRVLARRMAQRAALARPNDPAAWVTYFRALDEAGEHAGMLEEWEAIPASVRTAAPVRLLYALALRRTGKLQEALIELSEIELSAQDDKTLARTAYEIGLIEYGAGRDVPAVESFARAAKLGRAEWVADAHFNRGVCLDRLQRFREAAEAYLAATAQRPGFIDAWLQLGTEYRYRLGEPQKARDAYEHFLAAGGDDPEVRRYLERP